MTNEEQKKADSAKRFKTLLEHFANEPSVQYRLQSCSPSDFAKLLPEGHSDIQGLLLARQDYLSTLAIPTQTPQPPTETPITQTPSASAGLGAAGGLAALPLALLSREKDPAKYTEKELEKAGEKAGEKSADEAAKKGRFKKGSFEYELYRTQGKQKYYDDYATDPRYQERARQLAGTSQNHFLHAAIEKNNAALRAKAEEEEKIYVRNRTRLANALHRKSDPNALAQDYWKDYVRRNPKIARWISEGSNNQALLKAITADDKRIRSSISFRLNQSLSQRLGRNIPSTTGVVPRPAIKPGIRMPKSPGRAGGLAKRLNPLNLESFIQRNLQKIIIGSLCSFLAASVIATFFIVFFGGGGGVAGFSGSATGSPIAGGGTGQSIFTFVALGDSLTAWPNKPAGFVLDPSCASNNSCDGAGSPWPTQLTTIDTNLIQKNPGAAIAGDTTSKTTGHPGMVNRFSTDVANYHPDVLFVLGGTNDPGNGIRSSTTIANLKSIIANAQSAGIKKVILLTIPHQCSSGEYSSLNTSIKGLSSSYSPVIDISGASVLNCAKTSNDFTDFQIDKLHLTNQGAQKVAAYIDGQIKSRGLLPTSSGGTSIISWAKIIADATTFFYPDPTHPPTSCVKNLSSCLPHSQGRTRMVTSVTNGSYTVPTKTGTCDGVCEPTYYCTDLVRDSYNLAGIKNDFSQRSPEMAAGWPWHGGTFLINNSDINQQASNIQRLQTGDAMFYACDTTRDTIGHVDIIYAIDPNLVANGGNGRITTVDTNTPTVLGHLTLHNWSFTNYYSLEECDQAKYMWFGQPK